MISFALCMPMLFLIFLKKIGESLGNPIPLPIIAGKKENKKRSKYEKSKKMRARLEEE